MKLHPGWEWRKWCCCQKTCFCVNLNLEQGQVVSIYEHALKIQTHSRGIGLNYIVATQSTNLPLLSFVYSGLTIMWGISFVRSDNVRMYWMYWMYCSLCHCFKLPKDWGNCQRFRDEGYFLLSMDPLSFSQEGCGFGKVGCKQLGAMQHLWYKQWIHEHIPLISCILLQSLWGG